MASGCAFWRHGIDDDGNFVNPATSIDWVRRNTGKGTGRKHLCIDTSSEEEEEDEEGDGIDDEMKDFIVADEEVAGGIAGSMVNKVYKVKIYDEETRADETSYFEIIDVVPPPPPPSLSKKKKIKKKKKKKKNPRRAGTRQSSRIRKRIQLKDDLSTGKSGQETDSSSADDECTLPNSDDVCGRTTFVIKWLYTITQVNRVANKSDELCVDGDVDAEHPYTASALFESDHIQKLTKPGPDEGAWVEMPLLSKDTARSGPSLAPSDKKRLYIAGQISRANKSAVVFYESSIERRAKYALEILTTRGIDGTSTVRWNELIPIRWYVKSTSFLKERCCGCNTTHHLSTSIIIENHPCGASYATYRFGHYCAKRLILANKIYRELYLFKSKQKLKMYLAEFDVLVDERGDDSYE